MYGELLPCVTTPGAGRHHGIVHVHAVVALAPEGGQKRGVDVEHSFGIRPNNLRRNQLWRQRASSTQPPPKANLTRSAHQPRRKYQAGKFHKKGGIHLKLMNKMKALLVIVSWKFPFLASCIRFGNGVEQARQTQADLSHAAIECTQSL